MSTLYDMKVREQQNAMGSGVNLKKEAFFSLIRTKELQFLPSHTSHTSTKKGLIIFDADDNNLKIFDGVQWISLLSPLPAPSRSISIESPPEIKTYFIDEEFRLINSIRPDSVARFYVTPGGGEIIITIPRGGNCMLPVIDKRNNTLLGDMAYDLSGSEGSDNTFIGTRSGKHTSLGGGNTAVGSMAFGLSESGDKNVAVGYKSLGSLVDSDGNVAIGYQSLKNTKEGCNVSIGCQSQSKSVKGDQNTSVGTMSLMVNDEGCNNIAIGHESGFDSVGDNNILIGTKTSSGGFDDCIVIGSDSKATSSGQLVIGGSKISGFVKLDKGTGIVLNSAVTSESRIFLTVQSPAGVMGMCYIAGRIPGTGFTVSSTSFKDSSVVAWFMFDS